MRKSASFILSTIIAGAIAASASAQEFPSRNIDLIVPFDPGGAVDTTSRIIGETASTLLSGAEITVVNKSGGGGVVGQTFAANATPDGYTVLAMTSSVVTNPQMKGAGYSIDDFVPVALYSLDPEVIAVPAKSPIQTAKEFMAAGKEKTLNVVVAGVGTSHHMSGLAIERVSDVKFNYVPTKGFGAQVQAVAGGHVDGALWPLGEASAQAGNGSVRILAIASDSRHSNFPDVPTFQEAGIDIPIWATFRGWSVPKGTPSDVIVKLATVMRETYEDPDYVKRMQAAGFDPVYRDAAGFKAVIDSYSELTSVIIKEANLAK